VPSTLSVEKDEFGYPVADGEEGQDEQGEGEK
jgi:hypothetical protein